MPFQGLAESLSRGLVEGERRRDKRTQDAMRELQLEGMKLSNEAARQQLNAAAMLTPAPPVEPMISIPNPWGEGVIDVPTGQAHHYLPQGKSDSMVTPELAAALGMPELAGSPYSSLSEVGTFMDRSASAKLTAHQIAMDMQQLRGQMALPEQLELYAEAVGLENPIIPPADPDGFTSWDLFFRLNSQGLGLQQATADLEGTHARTRLTDVQAAVAQGNLELARETFDWKKFIDAQDLDQREREFAASEEGRAWREGFEERKQRFFENLSLRQLAGEEAAQAFNQFIAEEKLALDQARLALDEERFEHTRERDAISDEQWEQEFSLRQSGQLFDQLLRKDQLDWSREYQTMMLDLQRRGLDLQETRDLFNEYMAERQQAHREAVDAGRMSLDEARLSLDQDAQAFYETVTMLREDRAERQDTREQTLFEEREVSGDLPQTVTLEQMAAMLNIPIESIPGEMRNVRYTVNGAEGLSLALERMDRIFNGEDGRGPQIASPGEIMTLATRLYDSRYWLNPNAPTNAPTFDEFLAEEFPRAFNAILAISRGETLSDEDLSLIIPEPEEGQDGSLAGADSRPNWAQNWLSAVWDFILNFGSLGHPGASQTPSPEPATQSDPQGDFDVVSQAQLLVNEFGKSESIDLLRKYREDVKSQFNLTDEQIDQLLRAVLLTQDTVRGE